MLGVKPVRTTPYHPQTDELVERFNQTHKQMLRKMIDEEGLDWDKLVPYILFAYREVSQSSTGFSPFEMVYGRDVRGPLDILKEGLIGGKPGGDDIITYVIRIYEHLEAAKETVLENLQQAQQNQNTWYNKRAKKTQFEVGDKVLVLLPTRTEKLLAKWKGPYNVIWKVGKVNYELEMMDGRKGRKLFHVNMVKKWNKLEEIFVNQISDEEEEVPCYQKEQRNIQDAVYGEQLTKKQKEKVEQLIKKFPQVIQARNSVTTQVRHQINTTNQQPIRQRSYRIPLAIKRDVIKELQEMKDDGIVQESTSEWASPLVIVK